MKVPGPTCAVVRTLTFAVVLTATLTACKTRHDRASDGPGGALEAVDAQPPRAELPPRVRVPVSRVDKLASELASTGIFAEKDGRWAPDQPVADGGSAWLIVRADSGAVHGYAWAAGAPAPAAVERALGVGGAFASEVEREHPIPPCACRPGDPLCACR